MTAQNSVDFSKFGRYFCYKLRGLSPLIVLTSIFAFLSYPMGYFCMTMTAISYDKMNAFWLNYGVDYKHQTVAAEWKSLSQTPEWLSIKEQYNIWNGISNVMTVVMIIALAAMFLMGYFIIMRNFKYLYQKRYVDMNYSLPISEQTRFLGDFLSGLAAYLIPHLAALGIGIGLYANAVAQDYDYLKESNIYDMPIVQYMLTGLLACVMFYCLSLLVIVCCGRTTEAGIAPIAMNAVIPTVMITAMFLSLTNCSADVGGDRVLLLPFAATSPAGLLISSVLVSYDYYVGSENSMMSVLSTAELLCAILVTLAYAAGAMAIFLKRRSERVGEPYVIKPMRYIVSGGIILAVVSIFSAACLFDPDLDFFSDNLPFFIAMIILTFVLYVIMELISGRGFKKFPKTLAGYAAATGGSLLICLLLTFTNGFGLEYYVPSASNVKAAVASMYVQDTMDTWRYYYEQHDMILTDPSLIEKMTDIHSQSVKAAADDIGIEINYTLKSGNTLTRRVFITAQQAEDFLRAYIGSEDYKRSFSYLDKPFTSVYADASCDVDKIDVKAFKQALESDIETLTFDEMFNSKTHGKAIGIWISTQNITGDHYFTVYPYYKNAYAYLINSGFIKDGCTISDSDTVVLGKVHVAAIADTSTKWVSDVVSYRTLSSFVFGYSYDEQSEEDLDGADTEKVSKIYNGEYGVLVDKNSAEFAELLELCTASPVIYDSSCEYSYVLCVLHDSLEDDFSYIALPDGLSRAAEIFDSLAAQQAA